MSRKKKNIMFVWRCHQLMSGFLANGHLPRQLRLSDSDKADNEAKPVRRVVYRYSGI